MSVSFHGIGQVCATFLGTGTEGQVVKMSDRDTVAPCSDGNSFCGVALYRWRALSPCPIAAPSPPRVTPSSLPTAPAE